MHTMIDVDEAYEVLFSSIKPVERVEVPLSEALYRTLAAPVRCDLDSPPFDRSVMDGYAVRAEDVADAPVALRMVGRIPAGTMPEDRLSPGEVVQINTGALIPRGADAVVRVEQTELMDSGKAVLIRETAGPVQFITPRGTYIRAGQTVMRVGTRLAPLEIGAAAAAGAARVSVYRRPRVAVLATGDELVDIEQKPTGALIRNSNQELLSALISTAHAQPVLLGVARDDKEALRERIVEGLREDVLCITGGVSMGAFDFVPEVLEQCGATFRIRKMAIKPGRPTIFATTSNGTLIFALPGNPAGAFVGFKLLVRPALAALEGRSGAVPPVGRTTLAASIQPARNRRTYLPARAYVGADGGWEVETLSWQGSGDSFGMATANALIMRPPEADAANSGDTVQILFLDRT